MTLENGKVYNGSVVWNDEDLDLAIIKISASNLEYISLGDSDNIKIGDPVFITSQDPVNDYNIEEDSPLTISNLEYNNDVLQYVTISGYSDISDIFILSRRVIDCFRNSERRMRINDPDRKDETG